VALPAKFLGYMVLSGSDKSTKRWAEAQCAAQMRIGGRVISCATDELGGVFLCPRYWRTLRFQVHSPSAVPGNDHPDNFDCRAAVQSDFEFCNYGDSARLEYSKNS